MILEFRGCGEFIGRSIGRGELGSPGLGSGTLANCCRIRGDTACSKDGVGGTGCCISGMSAALEGGDSVRAGICAGVIAFMSSGVICQLLALPAVTKVLLISDGSSSSSSRSRCSCILCFPSDSLCWKGLRASGAGGPFLTGDFPNPDTGGTAVDIPSFRAWFIGFGLGGMMISDMLANSSCGDWTWEPADMGVGVSISSAGLGKSPGNNVRSGVVLVDGVLLSCVSTDIALIACCLGVSSVSDR